MASSDGALDIAHLSESQQLALQQYTSVTDQDIDAAIPLLQRSEWNVQIAIAKFFDGEAVNPLAEAASAASQAPPPRQIRHQGALIDSFDRSRSPSRAQIDPAPRVVPQPESRINRRLPAIFAILLTPFTILYRLLAGSASLFSYLFPFLPRLLRSSATGTTRSARDTSGRRTLNPRDSAARLIREFEEEYRSGNPLNFFEGGYAQALDLAKNDLKFLLVLLFSPEHDDTDSHVRETILSTEVVEYVTEPRNNIIAWAGNVQDSEAYQVSAALGCTKFPFACLISLTPRISPTAMSVITRITGPTPASAFVAKLQTAISEQAESLATVRSTRDAHRAERNLRDEQNSAYERSLEIDRRRAQEKRAAEAARRDEEKAALQKAEAAESQARKREQWKRWRAQRIADEPGAESKNITRISIRMRSGERVVRKFLATTEMEELYAFVECYEELGSPAGESVHEPTHYQHTYGFRLVSPMPRTVYDMEAGGSVQSRIGRSGNLIVETVEEEEEDEAENA